MKETAAFFSGLVLELAAMRQSAVDGLSALQTEQEKLKEEIQRAQDKHQKVRRIQMFRLGLKR